MIIPTYGSLPEGGSQTLSWGEGELVEYSVSLHDRPPSRVKQERGLQASVTLNSFIRPGAIPGGLKAWTLAPWSPWQPELAEQEV